MASAIVELANITPAGGASQVTFSNIASGYRDLRIVITGGLTGASFWRLMFNNSENAYFYSYMATDSSTRSGGWNSSVRGNLHNDLWMWDGVNMIEVNIFDAFDTNKNKTYLSRYAHVPGPNQTSFKTEALVGTWTSTAAITSIVVAPQGYAIAAGTTITLYGIKA